MVGTDDPRRALDALRLDQSRAAMAADIPEDVGYAILVPGEEQRDTETVMGDRNVGLG